MWDIWNFRNALVHGKGGVFQRANNRELDSQIEQEFIIGFANILPKDKYLFQEYTVSKLKCETITVKRHWLHSLSAARNATEVVEPIQQETQLSIIDFLTEIGANT